MMDYDQQLRFYVEVETQKQTETYFAKYWLPKSGYAQKWLPIQEAIYTITGPNFPDVRFRKGFEIITVRGGRVFTEEDFTLLQLCTRKTSDSYFVVVEHVDEDNPHHGEPPLRFKYPSNISWSELMSGGYVSQELFEAPVKEYFVYGDSGTWGKYVANDYLFPVDIIGFQKIHSKIFTEVFQGFVEPDVSRWLPPKYGVG